MRPAPVGELQTRSQRKQMQRTASRQPSRLWQWRGSAMCNRLEGLHKNHPLCHLHLIWHNSALDLPLSRYDLIRNRAGLYLPVTRYEGTCVLAADVTNDDPSLKLRCVSEDVQVRSSSIVQACCFLKLAQMIHVIGRRQAHSSRPATCILLLVWPRIDTRHT